MNTVTQMQISALAQIKDIEDIKAINAVATRFSTTAGGLG